LTVSGIMLTIGYLVLRAQRRPARTGAEGLVGEIGVVRASFAGGGRIFVHGEHWDAVSDTALAVGERVEVVRVESGLRLRVRSASAER
jgi:membrane-bound serine protease (ClpP class)